MGIRSIRISLPRPPTIYRKHIVALSKDMNKSYHKLTDLWLTNSSLLHPLVYFLQWQCLDPAEKERLEPHFSTYRNGPCHQKPPLPILYSSRLLPIPGTREERMQQCLQVSQDARVGVLRYDALIDDYKVVFGAAKGFIGTLCNGALHWVMYSEYPLSEGLISFDLSKEDSGSKTVEGQATRRKDKHGRLVRSRQGYTWLKGGVAINTVTEVPEQQGARVMIDEKKKGVMKAI
ncbi:hypothetical protein Tco_1210018 [Tanacetum coccineum]